MLTFLPFSASPFLRPIFSVSYSLFPSLHSFREIIKNSDFNSVSTRSSQERLPLVPPGARPLYLVTRYSSFVSCFSFIAPSPCSKIIRFFTSPKKVHKNPLSLYSRFSLFIPYLFLYLFSNIKSLKNHSRIRHASAIVPQE